MKTTEILIGRWGKIAAGEHAGWYVMVEDDTAGSTGGLYVHRCSQPTLKAPKGFDDWVGKREEIDPFFGFAKWEIEWLEAAAEPGAAPNGGPAVPPGDSGVMGGPQSVS